jgi:hypothetical protein
MTLAKRLKDARFRSNLGHSWNLTEWDSIFIMSTCSGVEVASFPGQNKP